jgi:hypothetical protein
LKNEAAKQVLHFLFKHPVANVISQTCKFSL